MSDDDRQQFLHTLSTSLTSTITAVSHSGNFTCNNVHYHIHIRTCMMHQLIIILGTIEKPSRSGTIPCKLLEFINIAYTNRGILITC